MEKNQAFFTFFLRGLTSLLPLYRNDHHFVIAKELATVAI
jgi:hypothetical protein